MAKAKVTAFVLDEKVEASIPSDEAQSFGTVPGMWLKGVPVLLSHLDPTLTEAEFKQMVKDANAPIVAVKVDADYEPKPHETQTAIMQKGGIPHLPSGLPLIETAEGEQADLAAYQNLSKDELETVAEARGVEDPAGKKKGELVDAIAAEDTGDAA